MFAGTALGAVTFFTDSVNALTIIIHATSFVIGVAFFVAHFEE